jgi:hypothetical protein
MIDKIFLGVFCFFYRRIIMLSPGEQVPDEITFAFRMLMVRYGLAPTDIMRILVAIEKENKKAPQVGGVT